MGQVAQKTISLALGWIALVQSWAAEGVIFLHSMSTLALGYTQSTLK